MGWFTLAPTLKMQASNGAMASAWVTKAATSASWRASSDRGTQRPPAASISAASGASLSPFRRPATTV